jgi:hypothetical protein
MHSTPGGDPLARKMSRMFTHELRAWREVTRSEYVAVRIEEEIRRRAEEGGYGLTAWGRGEVDE